MTIGERMKERRKELAISAETLADIIKVAPATIYRYENGDIEKVPSPVLAKIADALNTSFGYLMGWTDIPTRWTSEEVVDMVGKINDASANPPATAADQKTYDMISQLTPKNRDRLDAYLEGLIDAQDKPSD